MSKEFNGCVGFLCRQRSDDIGKMLEDCDIDISFFLCLLNSKNIVIIDK